MICYVHRTWYLCRSDHTHEEKESTIEELVREITALWQTDELRRKKPSALDGESTLHVLMCAQVFHNLKLGVQPNASLTTPHHTTPEPSSLTVYPAFSAILTYVYATCNSLAISLYLSAYLGSHAKYMGSLASAEARLLCLMLCLCRHDLWGYLPCHCFCANAAGGLHSSSC